MENDISRPLTEHSQQDDMESDKQRILQAEWLCQQGRPDSGLCI